MRGCREDSGVGFCPPWGGLGGSRPGWFPDFLLLSRYTLLICLLRVRHGGELVFVLRECRRFLAPAPRKPREYKLLVDYISKDRSADLDMKVSSVDGVGCVGQYSNV